MTRAKSEVGRAASAKKSAAPQSPAQHVARLRRMLEAEADPAYAKGSKAYLKSDLQFIGARLPVLRRVGAEWARETKRLPHDDLVAALLALWKPPVMDLRILAGVIAQKCVKRLTLDDVDWLEEWIRSSNTWALVDQLSVHVIGPILSRDAKVRARCVRSWAKDGDFWVRRTALLVQLLEFRKGTGDWDLWVEVAVPMLGEKEVFIRKALGWVLRQRGARHPEDVEEFVDAHRAEMSGLTLREATRLLEA